MNKNTEIINTFKDKIDWKFFNYIKDKMTLFEDKNISAILEIYACLTLDQKYIRDKHLLYMYITGSTSTEEHEGWTSFNQVKTPVKTVAKLYTEVVYGIFLFDEEHSVDKFGNWKDDYVKEFYETIKNKAILLNNEMNGMNTHILVRPR